MDREQFRLFKNETPRQQTDHREIKRVLTLLMVAPHIIRPTGYVLPQDNDRFAGLKPEDLPF